MITLPIEHAWMTMVAGMHVHEHFLEVWPSIQERRGRVLYDQYRATVDPQVPPLESLRERFPDAFLEHCYRQPDPPSFCWDELLRFAHVAASIPPFQSLDSLPLHSQGAALGYIIPSLWGYLLLVSAGALDQAWRIIFWYASVVLLPKSKTHID